MYDTLFLFSFVTEISFSQNLLGKGLTRCFIKISISVVHSLCFSAVRRIGNSLHYVLGKQELFK